MKIISSCLHGLERDKILKENEELNKLIKSLKNILSDKDKRMDIIKTELIEVKERYGDERRSEIEHSRNTSCEIKITNINESQEHVSPIFLIIFSRSILN